MAYTYEQNSQQFLSTTFITVLNTGIIDRGNMRIYKITDENYNHGAEHAVINSFMIKSVEKPVDYLWKVRRKKIKSKKCDTVLLISIAFLNLSLFNSKVYS